MSDSRYSATKLVEFFDYVIIKGLMNKETANSRKIASAKILEVLDEQERSDLRQLDIEDAFQRFVHLKGKGYSPQSLSVYRSRFSAAISDFIAWVGDPLNYRSATATRATKKTIRTDGKERQAGVSRKSPERPSIPVQPPVDLGLTDHLSLPIPLRKGVVVKISGLPSDLTPDEAKKIAAIVGAYAVVVEDKPQ